MIKKEVSDFLEKMAEALDISTAQYEQATKKLESITGWLKRDKSLLKNFVPEVYPQGSFLLGTVIKPLSNTDEYDIDCVCELKSGFSKARDSQKNLKDAVGLEVKSYAKAQSMNSEPEEGRRCWTLLYSEGAQFHMDVLPAAPDQHDFSEGLKAAGFTVPDSHETAIAITDNTHPEYSMLTSDWPSSNPLGYAAWFEEQMRERFDAVRTQLALLEGKNIDEIGKHRVKTTLQRVVQILKRHRDVMFKDDQDDKPISIIITTLAARSYGNEDDLHDALWTVIKGMDEYIEIRDNEYWVENPVNPRENFADKWKEHPARKDKFYKWLAQVRIDYAQALEAQNLTQFAKSLEDSFEAWVVNKALKTVTPVAAPGVLQKLKNKVLEWSQKFTVPYRSKPNWPVDIQGEAVVRASVKNGTQHTAIRHGQVIDKHRSLRFVAHTDIQHPYQVYWQVVNTGPQAAAKGGLRGEISNERTTMVNDKFAREESTLYTGHHCITCYVIKDGKLVAQSPDFEIRIP